MPHFQSFLTGKHITAKTGLTNEKSTHIYAAGKLQDLNLHRLNKPRGLSTDHVTKMQDTFAALRTDEVKDRMKDVNKLEQQTSQTHVMVKQLATALSKIDKTVHPAIHQLADALKAYGADYVNGLMSLEAYKVATGAALRDADVVITAAYTREARTVFEYISEAFRKMFNLFDRMIGYFTGSTMEATSTPCAQFFTGKDHFFNRPETGLRSEISAYKAFTDACVRFEDIDTSVKAPAETETLTVSLSTAG